MIRCTQRTTLFPYTTLIRSLRFVWASRCHIQMIPEDQLTRWSTQGGTTNSIAAHTSVRNALEANDSGLNRPDFEIYLQEIGRAHVLTPVTLPFRMPSSA